MFMQGHYQNAYVTHDLDKAMELLTRRYGVKHYIVFEPDMILKTPEGDKESSVRAALAWTGGLQIELIQPTKGWYPHYLPYLPADKSDPVPRFHHIAVRRDDLDAMRKEIGRSGMPLAFGGESAGMVFAYLDARGSLGHYIELVWKAPGGWEKIGWPGDRPVL